MISRFLRKLNYICILYVWWVPMCHYGPPDDQAATFNGSLQALEVEGRHA